ncbi:MAG: hypothetical protein M0Z95_12300 [Actinomycetota bacterium]|jgi:hypothetical protein|nr:hypothetical protein [Actinomycetota bacterium]
MLNLVHDDTQGALGEAELETIELDELCPLAAMEMLAVALLAERRARLEAHATELETAGHHLVVENGYVRSLEVVTGAGAVEVKVPRVDDRREGCRLSSAIPPVYIAKSPKVSEVVSILQLRGLSTGDFAAALGEFFGTGAGLWSSTFNRKRRGSGEGSIYRNGERWVSCETVESVGGKQVRRRRSARSQREAREALRETPAHQGGDGRSPRRRI